MSTMIAATTPHWAMGITWVLSTQHTVGSSVSAGTWTHRMFRMTTPEAHSSTPTWPW